MLNLIFCKKTFFTNSSATNANTHQVGLRNLYKSQYNGPKNALKDFTVHKEYIIYMYIFIYVSIIYI